MYLYRSNRTEALVEALSEVIAKPLGSPFVPECIVIQSRGLERWLAMELSKRLGVLANAEFPFPRPIIQRILGAILGDPRDAGDDFEPDTLMWVIADLLPGLLHVDAFAPLAHYLGQSDQESRLVELARRIAAVFDRYAVFRPSWLREWERGAGVGGDDWQALLWREVVRRRGAHYAAARATTALEILRKNTHREKLAAALPDRLSIFAVSSLPPFYLEIFNALSDVVEVHLFALSPCREYWAEARSVRESWRVLKQYRRDLADESPRDLSEGHRLLLSLGRLHRSFQVLLEQTAQYQESDRDLYREPGLDTMLTALQSDMLAFRSRGLKPGQSPPLVLGPDDTSIAIHSCHSPMREVEVLHDQLLKLFDDQPDLAPHDVVVMVPDIEYYSPYIDAVFGIEKSGISAIPYAVAARGMNANRPIADAFSNLLRVIDGRMTATELLDLLALEPIRKRFRIEAETLSHIRSWVNESGIRWGVDAAHRGAVDQPASAYNTWRFGLERLLLGYAMPDGSRTPFSERLASQPLARGSAEDLGNLTDFCESLFELRERFQHPRTITDWHTELVTALERFVERTDDNVTEHERIGRALGELARRAETAGYHRPVALETVRGQFLRYLQDTSPDRGLFSGGVTFCALESIRSIPFRVVYLLGMSETAFARPRPLSFDRTVQKPMLGDQIERDEVRRLFLEAILSARENLVISYVGQSISDNSELPASVLVDELIDTLVQSFRVAPEEVYGPALSSSKSIVDRLIVRHPLQAFSPRYFSAAPDSRLLSYARSQLANAKALLGERRVTPGFFDGFTPLADTSASPSDEVDLSDFISFFIHPLGHFFRHRLGLFLREQIDFASDREPAYVEGIERWKLGDTLLQEAMCGRDLDQALEPAIANGELPPGALGVCIYRRLKSEVEALMSAARPWRDGDAPVPLNIDLSIAGLRVRGCLRGLSPRGLLHVGYSRVKANEELRLWIRHLVLNAVSRTGYPKQSTLIGRPEKGEGVALLTFRPVDDPAAHLTRLGQLYRYGQSAPLVFLPEVSRIFAATLAAKEEQNDPRGEAILKARNAFNETVHSRWGVEDPYLIRAWGEEAPFERACAFAARQGFPFDQAAVEVFEPLFEHEERDR